MENGLLKYDVRVLMALKEALAGNQQFFEWMATNGYPELAAFSNMLQDDIEAEQWLVANHFSWLGIISHAIDGDEKSRLWLLHNLTEPNFMFVLACRNDETALRWLLDHQLNVLILLAKEVIDLRKKQELDTVFPYKMRF